MEVLASAAKKGGGPVPYRLSRLTRYMQDTLQPSGAPPAGICIRALHAHTLKELRWSAAEHGVFMKHTCRSGMAAGLPVVIARHFSPRLASLQLQTAFSG